MDLFFNEMEQCTTEKQATRARLINNIAKAIEDAVNSIGYDKLEDGLENVDLSAITNGYLEEKIPFLFAWVHKVGAVTFNVAVPKDGYADEEKLIRVTKNIITGRCNIHNEFTDNIDVGVKFAENLNKDVFFPIFFVRIDDSDEDQQPNTYFRYATSAKRYSAHVNPDNKRKRHVVM